jgi:hypothetical protein
MALTNRYHERARMRQVGTERLRDMMGMTQGIEPVVGESIA